MTSSAGCAGSAETRAALPTAVPHHPPAYTKRTDPVTRGLQRSAAYGHLRAPPNGRSRANTARPSNTYGKRIRYVDSINFFPNAQPAEATTMEQSPATIPLVLTIEQAAERLGIGRSLMYALVSSGEVESVTIGRLRRIPTDALVEYVARLRRANTTEAVA